jgi:glutamyl-Q tRNA(Asp) synthetase
MAGGASYALRLDVAAACARTGPLAFRDRAHGETVAGPARFGDIVLARKDAPASYHLPRRASRW